MKILSVITILAVTFFGSSAFAEEGVERVVKAL